MFARRVLAGCALVLAVTGATGHGSYVEVDEGYFAGAAVVGVEPIQLGEPAKLGFDLYPNGDPLGTPNPNPYGLYYSDPLETAFLSAGVRLGADDVAVSYPGNPGGVGARSLPNSLASDAATGIWGPHGTTEIIFVDPATGLNSTTPAAGAWFADGPTNEVHVSFYDAAGNPIANLVAPVFESPWFAGIQSDEGIARMQIWTSAEDDYYTEDLYYIPTSAAAVPEPSTLAGLLGIGAVGLVGWLGRRKKDK